MNKVSIAILFVFFYQLSFAAHIVSGTMHYTCLVGQEYQFTMVIYRDCSGGGADFDDPAPFALFRDDIFVDAFSVTPISIEAVAPQPYEDCDTNFPNYCLQRATYTFAATLLDPSATYYAVYQRCCWSNLIANLEEPSLQGVTIMTTVTPAAMAVCNAQHPIDFPLSVATCPGTSVQLSLPQMDSEGDSLVYELCTPLAGGGLGAGDPSACDGVLPTPPCPGPYDPVTYAAGFSEENPFPTVSGISLDPVTGVLSFVPTTIGRYIFGLCVTEYRNGEVLGYYSQPVESFASLSATNTVEHAAEALWSITHWQANEQMTISKSTAAREARCQLINIAGDLLWSTTATQINTIEVPLRLLSAGVYYLSIQEEDGMQTLPFVIQ